MIGLLGGGSAVYAKYDDAFRKNIEETLPFVKPVLDTLYGDVGVSKSQSSLMEKDSSMPFTPYVSMSFMAIVLVLADYIFL